MGTETTELTEVQTVIDGLSSPTDEEFMQAVRDYSDGAVASAAAKLAMAGGGGGGSLPAWWTVDSTEDAEEVTFGGVPSVKLSGGGVEVDSSGGLTKTFQVFGDSGFASVSLDGLEIQQDADTGNPVASLTPFGASDPAFLVGPDGAVTVTPSDAVVALTVDSGGGAIVALEADALPITGVADPTDPQDAATKNYVDTSAFLVATNQAAHVGDGATVDDLRDALVTAGLMAAA